MKHLDLFAGIGGFSLAARWMGWKTVAQVEWDKWCQKVLAKNFPDALRFGDIVEFNKMLQNGKIDCNSEGDRWKVDKNAEQILEDSKKQIREYGESFKEGSEVGCEFGGHGYNRSGINFRDSIGHIDILTGGFPCQPFSHAGKRKGTDDSRYLWPEMLTTIRILKPSFVVGENVAGLVSMENGKTLDRILSDLEDEGYTTEQVIVPACAVGAWHRRDRIWIIAYTLNGADRTDRGQGREAESISCECGQTGHSGMFSGTGEQISISDTSGIGCIHRELHHKSMDGREQTFNEITPSCKGRENVSDTVSQRGCSRDAGGEYAANVRELRRSQTDGYWDSEPHLGRVVARLSSTLDETLNDYKNGNANNQETITKIDLFRGQILRDMWNEQCPSSETSHRTEERQSNDFMLSMSHGYSHEKWKLGQRFKDNKDLSDLWQRILSAPLKETQDLQSGMLERVREIERNEKVASSRIDRLKGLGNAIVPQVAFQIFKAIEQYNELLNN